MASDRLQNPALSLSLSFSLFFPSLLCLPRTPRATLTHLVTTSPLYYTTSLPLQPCPSSLRSSATASSLPPFSSFGSKSFTNTKLQQSVDHTLWLSSQKSHESATSLRKELFVHLFLSSRSLSNLN